MPIDAGSHWARQRQLLMRADQGRAALYDRIGETISTLKGAGHDNRQIMQTLQPIMEPLRKLTMSSGRDETQITPQLALLFAKPAPQPTPVQSRQNVQTQQPAAAPDFHLNDIPDAHIDAAIDRAFEGLGV